jgi:hypothetical protein
LFVCETCGYKSAPKEQSWIWVTEKKEKFYALLDKKGNQVGTSKGWEIVKEKRLCSNCYKEAVKADEYRSQPEESFSINEKIMSASRRFGKESEFDKDLDSGDIRSTRPKSRVVQKVIKKVTK